MRFRQEENLSRKMQFTPILMRKQCTNIALGLSMFLGVNASAQTTDPFVQIGNLLTDALLISKLYITPATDAAVYQASSGWVNTPQKAKLWDFTLSLHVNTFFVPASNRRYTIENSDFLFFHFENGEPSASVPTALGNDDQVWLVGTIDDGTNQNNIRLETPEGVDMEQIVYPYLQGSLGLVFGTELVVKYSTKVQLKKGHYQVYGAGLKHNLSQYVPKMEAKNLFVSAFAGFSKEEISFKFLDTQTPYGTLGLNEITGLVDTWQFQLNASKKWNKFELIGGFITNVSDIEYKVEGERGQIEDVLPVNEIVNKKLEE
ncbi:MAG TPA: DUF6588 family protein, partial [Flavobacterium sp.]